MLKAIWPSIANIPNRLGTTNITTVGMMCYLLFWLFQYPFMLLSPQRLRYLFATKAAIVPFAWLAMLIWAMKKAPPNISLEKEHSTLHGRDFHWQWLAALNNSLAIYATLAVNIPDFTRYAKNERSQYIQLLIVPFAFTLVGFTGIAVTSAGEVLYGETLWDPLHLVDRWENRAAAFFASASFVLSVLGTNVSANSLSAANDMMVLFPKYINLRRGQVICAILGGWALCPWEILATAPRFLNFMSGYTIFLGPFAGIMIADYWLVHRCKVDVPAMYELHGRYHYWNGINWRAAIALLCSVTPNLPGLIASINPRIKVGQIGLMFNIAWLYGFFCAGGVYWLLSCQFPAKETFVDQVILVEHDVDGDPYGRDSVSHDTALEKGREGRSETVEGIRTT